MKTIWRSLAVVLALAIAAYLRFADLDTNPPGLWQDEAGNGLDAYLLWTTGRDFWGKRLPLMFQHLSSGALPLHRYLMAPVVGLLGLAPWTERLVSAASGFALVAMSALWARRVFGERVLVPVLASLALAPMAILFSRYGSEAILLPACLVGGTLAMSAGESHGRRAWLWVGAFVLALAGHTYHATKIALPLWMLAFLIYRWPLVRSLWKGGEKIHVLGPALLFTLAIAPAIHHALTPLGIARAHEESAFLSGRVKDLPLFMARSYLTYFEPRFLFISGGTSVAQQIPGSGVLNLLDLLFIPPGLVAAWRAEDRRAGRFVIAWFLLGPVPGALSLGAQNVGHVIGWLPAPAILSGLGAALVWSRLVAWTRLAGPALRRGAGPAFLALTSAAWLATASARRQGLFVVFPVAAESAYQFEISGALRCARALRKDERVVVSPAFPYAPWFARFFFEDVRQREGDASLEIEDRAQVASGELYVAPRRARVEDAEVACEVKPRRGGEPRARVYRARGAPRAP